MVENLEQKKRRLYGRKYFNEYMDVIKRITLLNENEVRVLSIVETDDIIEKERELQLKSSIKVFFKDKDVLRKFTLDKFRTEDCIYLFTNFSQDCGALAMDSINSFNFQFDFNDDPSGIIKLINSSLEDKILLDFYEEQGLKYIEVEYYTIGE
ncbi:hypothetical protein ACYSNM_12750 [Myroides sp. LJL116]